MKKKRLCKPATSIALLLTGFLWTAVSHAQDVKLSVEAVIIGGDPAPDGNGVFGDANSQFSNIRVTNAGLAFNATFESTVGGTSDNMGIVVTDGSSINQLVRSGESAGGNGTFTTFGDPILNSQGQTAFSASSANSAGGSSDNSGIFLFDGTSVLTVAREGSVAFNDPDTPVGDLGTFNGFSTFTDPIINEMGQVLFVSNLSNAPETNNVGLFMSDGVTEQTLLREGPAPDGNGVIGSFSISNQSLTDSGVAVLSTRTISDSVAGTDDNAGILTASSAGVNFVVRENDAVPGSQPGDNSVFESFTSSMVSINNSEQVLFVSDLRNTPNVTDNSGIYGSDPTIGLMELVRAGDSLPDGQGVFLEFESVLPITDSGLFVFEANFGDTLADPADTTGLFLGDFNTGVITTIVQQGDVAGLEGVFDNFYDADVSINENGQVLFAAFGIDQTDGGLADDSAIFLFDEKLGIVEIAREGGSFLGSFFNNFVSFLDDFNLDESGRMGFEFGLEDGTAGVAFASLETDEFLLGDVNLDGAVNLLDVGPFVTLLSDSMFQAEADINGDGVVNLLDVGGFVALLSGP